MEQDLLGSRPSTSGATAATATLPQPQGPTLLRRLGSWPGRHANPVGVWFASAPWALGAALLTWLLLIARQLPCRQTDVANPINAYYRLCYSDIPILYKDRHLATTGNPFGMEYPVLTGTFVALARQVAGWLGAPLGPGVDAVGELTGSNLFFAVNAVMLFVCFAATVVLHVLTSPQRPFDALMVAVSPVVLATGLINWDLFVVALTAVAVWAWSRSMPVTAGTFIGLGIAAKLYPVLLLVALLPLCLRSRRTNAFLQAVLGTALGWAVPNAFVALTDPEAWLYFWQFNAKRTGDLGSLWYVLGLAGSPVPGVSALVAVLDVVGAIGVIALGLLAPRRPRFGQLAFLMVCWFLLVNKVYSPQYVLWLLPLAVLARPVWRDQVIWWLGELAYYAAIWGHLAGTTSIPGVGQDRVYWLAVGVRMAAELWLCGRVVRDVLHPEDDVVRAGGLDDPQGGVFDGTDDAAWVASLRRGLTRRDDVDDADEADDATRAVMPGSPAPQDRATGERPADETDHPAPEPTAGATA